MNLLPGTTNITHASGDAAVGRSGKPCRVYSVHVVSGSGTAMTVVLLNGTTTGGTAYAQVDGVASKGVTVSFAGGLLFPDGCFADVTTTGTGDYCSIIASNEQ